MTLPIILGVLALALGVLSAVLTLLVGRRYHEINIANRKILGEFESVQKSHGQLHRSHTRRLNDIDPAIRLLEAQETQNSLVRESTGGIWSTGTGTKVQIRTMTDLHLANCIAWIEELPARERNRQQHREGLKMLRAEARRRRYGKRLEDEQAERESIAEERTAREFVDSLRAPMIAVEEKGRDPIEFVTPLTMERLLASGKAQFIDFLKANKDRIISILGERHGREVPDYEQIDGLVNSLIERTGLSKGLNGDLWKLRHLLARGRKS